MKPLTILRLSLASFAITTVAKQVGHFQSPDCVDPSGFESCYQDADQGFTSCVNNHCAGGSRGCTESCNGDPACVQSKCPDLGIDCINACECVKNTDYIDCAATSCWNQVYSCEYQKTVYDLLNSCVNTDYKSVPFFPPPDNAPGGCSCNLGRVAEVQTVAENAMNKCYDTMKPDWPYEQTMAYGATCLCCGQSSYISSIWDICPNTIPALLDADAVYKAFVENSDWNKCGTYLDNDTCTADLGFSNLTAFHGPGELPPNGTETLYNTGGVISTPISGNTFTWTIHDIPRPITAAATNKAVPTRSESGGKSATATAESGAGHEPRLSLWTLVGTIGAGYLVVG
ncbi:hypothetical protein BDV38DRAFT_83953 [Aspergillus pseudotamarii]|uniref:Extracellular membrane protein CFEM domain-containing protein n=1 Tax=Aspergillus pseudotamarii TaxID=132259 RepID=A0A5N6SSZ4_ASPPS|nr:uncharacterized protein BDV38DRAFT_83953 [Aspergillus pseudotamarii]KAE8137798.1 hypothetical protein BDV38DRAFT_83953 [Aspergillus pseudotamarii]